MEERLMDDPRGIKVKRNAVGGVEDATDELAPEEEMEIELPEEEILLPEEDEDLIGLAPSQLEKELARRKKEAEEAAAERDKLLAAGEKLLKQGKYEDAEPCFEQALMYEGAERAQELLWVCRTRDYSQTEPLMDRDVAEEFRGAPEEVKAELRKRLGGRLEEERKEVLKDAEPLRKTVFDAQQSRREAFGENKRYYFIRFCVFAALFCLCLIGAGASSYFIVRVTDSVPAIVTIVFGALALLDLVPTVLYARKLVVAQRLCRENEELSSTEDGERLEELEETLELLSAYLDD